MLSSVLGLESPHETEAEKVLTSLIFDDNEHLLSSLQLNQLASFTYHELSLTGGRMIHERMLDILENVIRRPFDVTVLAMHKALVVIRHLLLYGAEKVIGSSRILVKYLVQIAEKYNTAVMAQQSTGAVGFILRLKGGAVDKGGPAREVAQSILDLLSNPQQLQNQRQKHADPNSLVPVGSKTRVGFITDEARYAILQRRMERDRQVILKSNLAKSDSAFGGGYTSRDGKAVVGAAHSLEEMIKEAEKKQKAKERRFTDAPKQASQPKASPSEGFSDYQAPSGDLLSMNVTTPPLSTGGGSGDLLDFQAPAPVGDIFEASPDVMGSLEVANASNTTLDIFAGGGGNSSVDIFANGGNGTVDIFANGGNGTVDIFASGGGAPQAQDNLLNLAADTTTMASSSNSFMGDLSSLAMSSPAMSSNGFSSSNIHHMKGPGPTKKQPMSSSFSAADPFAALDAVSPTPMHGMMSSQQRASNMQLNQQQQHQRPGMMQSHQRGMSQQQRNLSMNTSSLNMLGFDMRQQQPKQQPKPSVGLNSLGSLVSSLPTTSFTPSVSSLRVSSVPAPYDDDDAGGYVMGGPPGAGLEPTAPPPKTPPPPPPPAWLSS